MPGDTFAELDRILDSGDPASSLDFLIESFRNEKKYRLLFEARLMKKRLELGMPLVQTDTTPDPPAEDRAAYERAMVETARETGSLFLSDGDIANAWPYFRAIGEREPIVRAIEKVEPGEDLDAVIAIAYQEGVHPAKGLELILKQHGMCRAITSFGMYGAQQDRDACIALLVRGLHAELVERMARSIEEQEGQRPQTSSVIELMAGRDWLFGEYGYYVDTSHLTSVLQYAPDVKEPEILSLLHELCDYGKHLSAQFQFRGDPPFESPYADYDHWVQTLRGVDVEAGLAHYREKVRTSDPEQAGTAHAQALITLLVRLGRPQEALEVALEHLSDATASDLNCPSAIQLCHLAKDYGRLRTLARDRGDLLSYAAASLEKADTTA